MDDLGRRLREANPHAQHPLPDRARQTLDDLLSGRRRADWARGDVTAPTPGPARRGWRTVTVAGGGVAVIATLVLLAFVFAPTPAAVAVTPDPLTLHPTSWTIDSLREAVTTMKTTPDRAATSTLGAEWTGWYLQLDADDARNTFIQPQRTRVQWNPDLSGSSRTVAEAPLKADGSTLDSLPRRAARAGETVAEDHWGPGEMTPPFTAPPPEDTDAMRVYLDTYLSEQGVDVSGSAPAGEYVFALTTLMQIWTLDAAAQRSAISVILDSPGVTVIGDTRDRAGRTGAALEITPIMRTPDFRSQLVIDASRMTVLSLEVITISGLPQFNVPPGSTTEYTLWR